MKLPGKLNTLVVVDLEARLKGVQDCILIGHEGMPASQAFEFRGRLRQSKCRMRVVKNAVGRVAFEKVGLASLAPHLKGSSALLYGEGEALLGIAQVVTEWNKDKAKKPVSVKAGLLARALIGPKDVERLAAIPPRQVLLTQMARGVAGPLSRLVGTLSGVHRRLVYGVKAVAEKRSKEVAA